MKRVKFGVSGHYPENTWREWPEILHSDVFDHFQNWLVYGFGLLIYRILAVFWLSETGQIWGFPAYPGERIGGNGMKYGMLLYPDHIQNWLDYGHSLLIFLILVLFWLSEMGQIWGFQAFSEKPIEEMAWNFACWYILTTFRTDKIMVTVCRFF